MSEINDASYQEFLHMWRNRFSNVQFDQFFKAIPQEAWELQTKSLMIYAGWVCDRDDETTLGFSNHQGEHQWIKDYDKKSRTFVQYDGNQKVNLRVTNDTKIEP